MEASSKPHHASVSSIDVSEITLYGFYFVPKDAVNRMDADGVKNLKTALEKTKRFYESQTSNSIKINIAPHEQPVLGYMDASYYNGVSTNNGNPNALLEIQKEITNRIEEGNLEIQPLKGLRAVAILYEDVGASATLLTENPSEKEMGHIITWNENDTLAMLVSNFFFTGNSYKDYGSTIFAHEFGHILGLKDEYTTDENSSKTEDIMGSGRFIPLEYSFLSNNQLKSLGIE